MQLFAHNHEVEPLDAQLDTQMASTGAPRTLEVLLPLAWHLRQRDTRRAIALADKIATVLFAAPKNIETARALARVQLIRGEAAWLSGDLDRAEALVDEAQAAFAALDDATGVGDAHWLRVYLCVDRGSPQQRAVEAARAVAAYLAAGDRQRHTMAVARGIYLNAFTDSAAARSEFEAHRLGEAGDADPAVAAWVGAAAARLASLGNEFGLAARRYEQVYAAALQTGQLRQAIIGASGVCGAFLNLNNPPFALEWSERGLAMARAAGWPMLVGDLLASTGEVLGQLGHHESARAHLADALVALEPSAGSGSHAAVLKGLGEVSLALGEYQAARDWFSLAEARYRGLGWKDMLADALRGRAEALAGLGDPAAALSLVDECLALCRENNYRAKQIELLRIAAGLHRRLPVKTAGVSSLQTLNEALALAEGIEGYNVPHGLLEEAAAEYAAQGDPERAYRLALQAGVSRQRVESKEAGNRALALQVRHETERIHAETEHHKQLAATEARRADALLAANSTLEDLGKIGREITASLDAASVFGALDRHVHSLLDATHFAIYLVDDDGRALMSALIVEAGETLPRHRIALDSPTSNLARCVREGREIVLTDGGDADTPHGNLIPGTLPSLSQMFAPLKVGEQTLGAMTIQSRQADAYAERETAIFRTLCAYGAIALANGHAYSAAEEARRETARALEELKALQAQLVEKNRELESLSTTDRLTGLANRLRLEVALAQELARCGRHPHSLSLILVDIDHFKNVNDTHGHDVGDAVLVEVAGVLRNGIRKTDLAGRWGGEEFLLVCIDTPVEEAAMVAEKIRAALAALDIAVAGPRTASFGVSCYRPGDDIKSLMRRADAALYRAKQGGRNCVESG